MTTNSQAKYREAIARCDLNRDALPPHCKYRLMSNEKLYKMLEGLNQYWDARLRVWRDMNAEEGASGKNGKVQAFPLPAPSNKTLIRIIAHRDVIARRVSELVELCEALNWQVTKITDPLGDNGVEFVRVHITVIVSENGD